MSGNSSSAITTGEEATIWTVVGGVLLSIAAYFGKSFISKYLNERAKSKGQFFCTCGTNHHDSTQQDVTNALQAVKNDQHDSDIKSLNQKLDSIVDNLESLMKQALLEQKYTIVDANNNNVDDRIEEIASSSYKLIKEHLYAKQKEK